MTAMLINVLLYVMVLLRLWTAAVLFLAGRQNKLPNLYWLALAFAVYSAGAISNLVVPAAINLWLYIGLMIISMAATVEFVRQTFYRNRRSPAPWMWLSVGVLGAAALYGIAISPSPDRQHPLVAANSVLICVVYGWQAWAGYQAWQQMAREKLVDDWVKGRYQLVIWYSGFQFTTSLCSVIRILAVGGSTSNPLGAILALVALVGNIGMVTLAYLAWAAPTGFYRWLNRNYKAAELGEINEEEVMKKMMGS
jgi:hypothetical protein